jgi:hypothetical protein
MSARPEARCSRPPLEDAFESYDAARRHPEENGPGLSPGWRWSVGAATDRGVMPGATFALRF